MSLALLFPYLFTAQHVSNVSTSIFRSLRLIYEFIALVRCVLVLRYGSAVMVWYPYAGWSTGALLLNMFRMLVHPSSGACDLLWICFTCCIALVRCVLVLRCGSAGVVWYLYTGWSTSLDRWIKIDQLDVTCFIISLFTAQHVSNVSTSIFRSMRLIVEH